MESLPRLGATAEGGEIGAALDRAGCCVIDRVVAPEVMDAIVTDLEPYAIDGAFGVGEFEGRRTRRTGAVVLRSPTYRSIVRHPAVVAAGDQSIEVEVNALWVVTDFPEPANCDRTHRPTRFRRRCPRAHYCCISGAPITRAVGMNPTRFGSGCRSSIRWVGSRVASSSSSSARRRSSPIGRTSWCGFSDTRCAATASGCTSTALARWPPYTPNATMRQGGS